VSYEDPEKIKPKINWSSFYFLQLSKEKIEYYADTWDVKKRLTNPYEYIHTPPPNSSIPVCKLQPLSRAYFKMIEILYEYDIVASLPLKGARPITSYHLAEGPGGFIEALLHIRKNPEDVYYGMTLLDDTPTTPGWKKAVSFLKKNPNIIIDYGADGTGNLLSSENLLQNYKDRAHTCDIITGDGGFDFSVDYGKQELTASWLIFAQICHALILQKTGGTFILKMFDVFHNISIEFLYLLSIYYDTVSIYKPLTSREANSERYIFAAVSKTNALIY
jgi:23S rRNA U2552 (ribose-2'-O)-methylase RlmE/FtsJ